MNKDNILPVLLPVTFWCCTRASVPCGRSTRRPWRSTDTSRMMCACCACLRRSSSPPRSSRYRCTSSSAPTAAPGSQVRPRLSQFILLLPRLIPALRVGSLYWTSRLQGWTRVGPVAFFVTRGPLRQRRIGAA